MNIFYKDYGTFKMPPEIIDKLNFVIIGDSFECHLQILGTNYKIYDKKEGYCYT